MSEVKFNLDIDYKRPDPVEDINCPSCNALLRRGDVLPRSTNSDVTVDYIRHAVGSTHEKGIEGQMRRIWGRIDRALDAALEGDDKVISIEQAGYDFVQKSIEKCTVDSRIVKFFVVFEKSFKDAGETTSTATQS